MKDRIVMIVMAGALAIAGQERPAFEVASIKPAKVGARASFFDVAPFGERFTATNASLRLLMMAAYGVTERQVSGGPPWIDSEHYDIAAKAERAGTRDQILLMLQELLADRFRLKVHKESMDVPVYVLTVENPKLGLRENKSGDKPHIEVGNGGQFIFRSDPMTQLVWYLSVRLRRDVIDKTGLKGNYDFELSYTPDTPSFGNESGNASTGDRPPLQEAVRDQLGLKLQSQKGLTEVFVIDSAEKPAEN